jgi:hypothetical protein
MASESIARRMTPARQLHLFKSKRQRGVAPPALLEFPMQCAIADLLDRWAKPTWIWQHIPGGEERPAEFINGRRVSFAGARLKRAGFKPGWPDFLLLAPGGKPHCLELKRRGGTPTEAQSAFALWCQLNGVPHAFVHSIENAVDVLRQWGVWKGHFKVQ